jgi:translation initiation factor 2 alpha subunit (eIF-2alpha)
MALEEGDTVLCTVERIEGTNVFVNIEGDGEGSIMTSEIAPGRIRNIRDYVVPKKKIVCKVLKVFGNRIDLSLRRVTQKEQKEVMEHYKLERSYISILNTILKEEAEAAIRKILDNERLYDFFEEVKSNPQKLEEIMSRENAGKILEIINAQKQKKFEIKREISLSTVKPDGLELIKGIFSSIKNAEVKYISAGHYSLKAESSDIKNADNILKNIISEIEKNAKKFGVEFSILEK